MLHFIFGVWVGGIICFAIWAICNTAGSNDRTKLPRDKETGDRDATNK